MNTQLSLTRPSSAFARGLIVWTAWFVCLFTAASVRAQMYKGTQLVKAGLLADTTAITAGKPFTVGLRLRMAPHWHTYWQNSGDAGLPTKLDWQLPDGFKAGPLQWPLPTRIDSPGDIVNYGYGEQVVLLTEITPPIQLPAGEVALKAKATWLVCAGLCVPGESNLALKLPAGGEAAPANTQIFAETRALLPRPASEGAAALTMERHMDGTNLLLNFNVPADPDSKYGVEFFPLPPENVEVGHPATVSADNQGGHVAATVKVPITANPAGADKVAGVLVLTGPDGDRVGYVVGGKESTSAPTATSVQPVPPTTGTDDQTTTGKSIASASTSNESGTAAIATHVATPNVPTMPPAKAAGSVWYYLLLGFVGGLILNVMPCVLPVISLKLFSFVKQANEDPARVFKLGLAYAAGVFAWFLGFAALVVILKAAGREVGYSFQFQNSWFIVGLCAAVFVFSMNLLGVFEFVLPGVFGSALTTATQRNEGYGGAFFQGVLATVLGSACTGPLFGSALGFAFSQNTVVIFTMFAAIAAGMSLPFLLLSAQPGWLRWLPKPGVWMERVKQATGFLMLGTVLWLLSVLGATKGADAVVWMGVFLLVLGAVCWIQGSFNTLVASGGTRAAAWLSMGVLLVAGGWLSVWQISQSRRPVVIDPLEMAGTSSAATNFSDRLQAALKGGQTVLVDFTADWCVNCKVNERVVLNTSAVQQALKSSNTRFMTADWTDGADDITILLRKFGRAGVPLYVIYPADRTREPIVLPELLTQQIVLDGLKSAAASKQLAGAATIRTAIE